jgi:adenosylcobinamide kinase/adenosylcobinamide-phosphate guanylyltransferase
MSDTADSRLQSATLVLGGARSGKSRHAEALVAARAGAHGRLIYVATAAAGDAEMAQRIAEHQARRGARWTTVEAPLALAAALRAQACAEAPILVDCLTLWLSNLMLAERDIDAATTDLLDALAQRTSPVVLVSNEVGLGIVPDNALARRFRDAAGILNQRVAAACGTVILMTAGLPLTLKEPA